MCLHVWTCVHVCVCMHICCVCACVCSIRPCACACTRQAPVACGIEKHTSTCRQWWRIIHQAVDEQICTTFETHSETLWNQCIVLQTKTPKWGASPCNAPQHTATHCNTLQHTTTHCFTTDTEIKRIPKLIGQLLETRRVLVPPRL